MRNYHGKHRPTYRGKHRLDRSKAPALLATSALLAAVLLQAGPGQPAVAPAVVTGEFSTVGSPATLDEEMHLLRLKAQQNLRAIQTTAAKRAAEAARAKAAKVKAARAAAAERARWNKGWGMPLKSRWVVTSRYGPRLPMRFHTGVDLAVPIGTKVYSMSSGEVIFAGPDDSGFGNLVKVRCWDGTVIYYGHLSKFRAKVGDYVSRGQLIALSGNTGYSTGPHLHIDVHPRGGAALNPTPWMRARGLPI